MSDYQLAVLGLAGSLQTIVFVAGILVAYVLGNVVVRSWWS